MVVLITLTAAGDDTGPFSLYSDVDSYATAFETNVSKASLLAGYTSVLVPASTTTIKLVSVNDDCDNYVFLVISQITTTTTTAVPTTTTTTTANVLSYEIISNIDPECSTCPKTAGSISVGGTIACTWFGTTPLPKTGTLSANGGTEIIITADGYAGGSGCVDVQAVISIYINDVSVAIETDATATWTFTYNSTTKITVEITCIAPPA